MPRNNPRIKAVRPGSDPYTLVVTWAGGLKTAVDLTGVVARSERFQELLDADTFADVGVVTHGWGIGWGCGADYSADSIARLARQQKPMTGEDFARWMRNLDLSNQEASDVLGVSLTTVKNHKRAKGPLPAVVAIACSALAEDKTAFFAHYRPRYVGRPRAKAAG